MLWGCTGLRAVSGEDPSCPDWVPGNWSPVAKECPGAQMLKYENLGVTGGFWWGTRGIHCARGGDATGKTTTTTLVLTDTANQWRGRWLSSHCHQHYQGQARRSWRNSSGCQGGNGWTDDSHISQNTDRLDSEGPAKERPETASSHQSGRELWSGSAIAAKDDAPHAAACAVSSCPLSAGFVQYKNQRSGQSSIHSTSI